MCLYLLNLKYKLNRALLEDIVNLYFYYRIAIVSHLKMPGETGLAVAKKKGSLDDLLELDSRVSSSSVKYVV